MNHHTDPAFWEFYHALPAEIRILADGAFQLMRQDIHHPSLHFKKVGKHWSARIGKHYRALAQQTEDGYIWFWIGHHAVYDRRIK